MLNLFLPTVLWAQNNNGYKPDEGMDLFLLVLASLFVAAMLGAALVGALLATLLVLLLASLFGFGILSASVAVGFYNRSVATGFKTILLLFFGITGAFFSAFGLVLVNKLFLLHLTSTQALLVGLSAGLCGGVVLALVSFSTIKNVLHQITKSMALRN